MSNLDFSFLDSLDLRGHYSQNQDFSAITFYVPDIRCEKCIRKIESLAHNNSGIQNIQVELGNHLVHVEIDPALTSYSRLATQISEIGFNPIPIAKANEAEKLQKNEAKHELIRLAVAGTLAGNIMTFSLAAYFGGPSYIFEWLSFSLYLPVLLYVANPFYKGAWNSLKRRELSIDLPMAIASVAGFSFSTVELLRQTHQVYFDSLSGFLFLILLSRFLQRKLQRYFLSPMQLNDGLKLERVRKYLTPEKWAWTSAKKLKQDDLLSIHQNETLPGDCELIDQYANVSFAWLTGEARSKTALSGTILPAGTRSLTKEVRVRLIKPLEETEFGKILESVNKFSFSNSRSIYLSDRIAQWLLVAVFAIAGIFLLLYWPQSPELAIQRSLALIILACPCAMAFGTPLALAMALKKARTAGIIVKDASIFEKVNKVKTILFDKTGTLTECNVKLDHFDQDISNEEKSIVLGLENISYHPVAFALREAFKDVKPKRMESLCETPGLGVSGKNARDLYKLIRDHDDNHKICSTFYKNEKKICSFYFSNDIKRNGKQIISELRDRKFNLALLTGDNESSAQKIGQFIGLQSHEIHSDLTPEQKSKFVKSTNPAMMVGDGVNDSYALMNSTVGIAVNGGVESALKSSQAFLASDDLASIIKLIDISNLCKKLINQNITISIIYNLSAGTLALLGYINPFIAAILMPISSGFILLTTWITSKL